MKKINLLIVEESKVWSQILAELLGKNDFDVRSKTVSTIEDFENALLADVWDVVVSEFEMSGFNGLKAFQILRTIKPNIPFVLLSEKFSDDIAVSAMRAGIDDYVSKDEIVLILPVINRAIRTNELRRRAQAELENSESRYRNLFENAGDMIYTLNLQGEFTSINKKGLELLGFSPSEILGKKGDDFLEESEAERIRKLRGQRIRNAVGALSFETIFKTKSGELRTFEIKSHLIFKNDQPFEIQSIARDVTEQKKLLNDIQESEKRLNLALNGAKMGVWEWDIRTNAVFWSPECYTVLQHPTLGGHLDDFLRIVHPDDLEAIWIKVNQAIEQRTTFTAEYRIISSMGETIWVFDQGIAEYDDSGAPLRCIGTFRDITSEKYLENELLASESRFRTLTENNVAGVTLGKPDGELIFVNDAYLQLTGYSREDFDNGLVNCHLITPPEYHHLDDKGFEEARRFGKCRLYEKEYLRKDGKRVPVVLMIALNRISGEDFFICTILDFSERKKVEKELSESVEDFRALVEASSQIVWTMVNGNINRGFSDFWENLTGQNYKQTRDMGWLAFIHPDDREMAKHTWTNSFTNNIPLDSVYRILTRSGKYQYFAVRAVPVFEDDKSLRKWIGTFSDISGQKSIEAELRESESRLKQSQEAGRVGTYEWNFVTDRMIFSETLWSIYGLKSDELEFTYDLFKEFAHPDDLEYVERELTAALDGRDTIDIEFRIIKRDNQTVWLASKGRVYRDENGNPERLVGINLDVTERKMVEGELRRSEERFLLAQEGAKIGTGEWNLTTNQAIWSDGVWAQLGIEPGTLEPNLANYIIFILPEDRDNVKKHFKGAITEKTPVDTEYRLRRSDGKMLWVAAKGTVIYDKTGKPERMVGVTIDITDRKNAEENLQISEEKLRQAQKLESIGRLAGGIAHDFNNMLTAINGYSDLILQQMKADEPHRKFIEEIRKSGERSAALTQQLLAFSRRQMLQPKILNLNKVVADTTVMLQRLIGEDVRLVEKFGSENSRVKADPGQITQVIMNLAVNARDAMPKGGTLTIETENVDLDGAYIEKNPWVKEGKYVLLKVSDTGVGIEKDILENIFEPFYTTKEIGVGTGLGLATVYGIIKQSEGHINVHSVVNEGTTFEIYLPQTGSEGEKISQSYEPVDALNGSETILVVEDEETVRKLTCQILKAHGYQIISARNGLQALQICEINEHSFDLLLTDVVMPKMGGHELADRLFEKFPQIAALFTSGYSEDASYENKTSFAVSDFIHKPFTPDSLAKKVREVLDKREALKNDSAVSN